VNQGEVPVIPAGPIARPRTLLPAAGLAAAGLAGLALGLSAGPAAGQATADAAPKVVRTTVPLAVDKQQLGDWRPLVAQRGAKVTFKRVRGDETVLRLADRPRRGGFVAVSASLGPQTAVGGKADVNLTRQRLARGRARALLTVDSAKGGSVQAGVIRVSGGRKGLRWALWFKDNAGDRSDFVVSRKRAKLRAWQRLEIVTRWGRDRARASLKVNGTTVVLGAPRDLSGVVAQRVTLGLGRPSAPRETGAMLVRSARVKAAIGLPGGGSGAGGGSAPGGPPAGAPGPANPTVALPGRELMRADFETGNLSQWDSVQAVASDRIQVVGSPVRQGSRAGKFTVHSGDDPLGGNYGDRAEVSLDTNESEGDERWYTWSTMVGTDMPRTSQFQVISQWHSRENGQPPVAFFAENDSLVLMIHPHSSPGNLIRYVRAWSGPLRRGEWQDITMHVKWSGSDAIGFVELWINGARQTFSDGTQTMRIRTTYPGIDNYFKQGYYRQFGISQTGTVYHDGFRMNAPG
jgi:hypothetical protein